MPEPEVKVEVIGEAEKDTSQEKVEVTPDPKLAAEDQLAAKIKADFEQLYGSRIKQVESQFENFRHGAYRIQDDLKKQVEQLKAAQTKSSSPDSAAGKDPWAGIENGPQWKTEIEKLAEQKAEEKLRAWQTEQQAAQAVMVQKQTLEGAKQQVIAKYPDLDPEAGTMDSLVSKTYVAVLNEHPDWLTNPYGPVLAMYAMEEKLKVANGSAPAGAPAKSRTSITGLPQSRPTASSGERLTLTREQKAFCDRHNLKYEDYIKTAASLEQGAVEA